MNLTNPAVKRQPTSLNRYVVSDTTDLTVNRTIHQSHEEKGFWAEIVLSIETHDKSQLLHCETLPTKVYRTATEADKEAQAIISHCYRVACWSGRRSTASTPEALVYVDFSHVPGTLQYQSATVSAVKKGTTDPLIEAKTVRVEVLLEAARQWKDDTSFSGHLYAAVAEKITEAAR